MTIAVDSSTAGGSYTGTNYTFNSANLGSTLHRIALLHLAKGAQSVTAVTLGGVNMTKLDYQSWDSMIELWMLHIPDDWTGAKSLVATISSSAVVNGVLTIVSDALTIRWNSFSQPHVTSSTTMGFSLASATGDLVIACSSGNTTQGSQSVGAGETKRGFNATQYDIMVSSKAGAVGVTCTHTFGNSQSGMGIAISILQYAPPTTVYCSQIMYPVWSTDSPASPQTCGIQVHGGQNRTLVVFVSLSQATAWKAAANPACTINWGGGAVGMTRYNILDRTDASASSCVAAFVLYNCPEGDATLSVSWTGSGGWGYFAISPYVFSATDTFAPIHDSQSYGAYSSNAYSVTLTTSTTDFLIGVTANGGGGQRTPGANTIRWGSNTDWQVGCDKVVYIQPCGEATSVLALAAGNNMEENIVGVALRFGFFLLSSRPQIIAM